MPHRDIAKTLLAQDGGGASRQLGNDFDSIDPVPQRAQDRGLISGSRAYFQNAIARTQIELACHMGHDERIRDGLAVANGERHGFVCGGTLAWRDEILARKPSDDRKDRAEAPIVAKSGCQQVSAHSGHHIGARAQIRLQLAGPCSLTHRHWAQSRRKRRSMRKRRPQKIAFERRLEAHAKLRDQVAVEAASRRPNHLGVPIGSGHGRGGEAPFDGCPKSRLK